MSIVELCTDVGKPTERCIWVTAPVEELVDLHWERTHAYISFGLFLMGALLFAMMLVGSQWATLGARMVPDSLLAPTPIVEVVPPLTGTLPSTIDMRPRGK